MATFQDYLNHINTSTIRKPKVKIEFLRYDETPFNEVTGDLENNSGSLTIQNKNGTRRSISFNLINMNGKYVPNPDGIWLRQKIRIWLGLEVFENDIYYINQGVFVLENPSITSTTSSSTLSISAQDKFSLLDGTLGGELNGIYILPVSTNIKSAIELLLSPSSEELKEVVYDTKKPIIHSIYNSYTTPHTIEKTTGDNIGSVLLELADLYSSNIYYNVDGNLVFEPDFNDSTKGVIHSYEVGDINYLGCTKNYPFNKIFNAVLVIGANVNGEIYDYLAENNNPQSDTSIQNVGFRRVLTINDSNINSTELAQSRALYELKRITQILTEDSITSVPLYHLDVDYIIESTNPDFNQIKKRSLINSITIPLATNGTMTISCADSIDFYL